MIKPAVCPIWVLLLIRASAYCSILKLMMLSHHTPANAKYAELLDIAESWHPSIIFRYLICRNRLLTLLKPDIHLSSFVISSAEIDHSSFDLSRNCSLLIYWLLLIKRCRWLTSLSFCSHYYLPTEFCTSPSWFLTSFLASGFFALLSCHSLSQVHQRVYFTFSYLT